MIGIIGAVCLATLVMLISFSKKANSDVGSARVKSVAGGPKAVFPIDPNSSRRTIRRRNCPTIPMPRKRKFPRFPKNRRCRCRRRKCCRM